MIQLVEIVENSIATRPTEKYTLREIYISPEHIIMVRDDPSTSRVLMEAVDILPDLKRSVGFSKITINRGTTGQEIVVVGTVSSIYEKIESVKIRTKQLLRG
jgi:hypothetical protein